MNPAEEALQLLCVRREVLFLLVGCCDSAAGVGELSVLSISFTQKTKTVMHHDRVSREICTGEGRETPRENDRKPNAMGSSTRVEPLQKREILLIPGWCKFARNSPHKKRTPTYRPPTVYPCLIKAAVQRELTVVVHQHALSGPRTEGPRVSRHPSWRESSHSQCSARPTRPWSWLESRTTRRS